jgi:crossover junction endodeoxyribonuclease RuvC
VIVLGVDPGLSSTGYGAILIKNSSFDVIEKGYIKTNPTSDKAKRLGELYLKFEELLMRIKPDLVAVENAFSLLRYPKAGIILGEVLGVIYLSIFQKNVAYLDMTPREIKNAIVGYGNAPKEQIRKAVKRILGISKIPSSHASDAIAAAIAGFYRLRQKKEK